MTPEKQRVPAEEEKRRNNKENSRCDSFTAKGRRGLLGPGMRHIAKQEVCNLESSGDETESGDGELSPEREPVLCLDVNIGEGKIVRLYVYEDDDLEETVQKFSTKHGLYAKKRSKLSKALQQAA